MQSDNPRVRGGSVNSVWNAWHLSGIFNLVDWEDWHGEEAGGFLWKSEYPE